jgi:hypothetical protein
MCVETESTFDFLKDLVADISEKKRKERQRFQI